MHFKHNAVAKILYNKVIFDFFKTHVTSRGPVLSIKKWKWERVTEKMKNYSFNICIIIGVFAFIYIH